MENNNFWWYVIPFCLGVASLTLTLYGYHERTTTEQAVEEPVKVTKTVATEQKKRKFQWVRLNALMEMLITTIFVRNT